VIWIKAPCLENSSSSPPGLKLLELFVSSNFEISTSQWPTHYISDGRGDALDIVVHQNVRLQEIIGILDHVRDTDALDPVENITVWEPSTAT
jgi:hypothetical protein